MADTVQASRLIVYFQFFFEAVSDDGHERSTKKDLLIGKRKEKKESKKDLGYAALEGESSPEEELDVK